MSPTATWLRTLQLTLFVSLLTFACADYFTSSPACGFPSVSEQFVSTTALSDVLTSVGVCNWGITNFTYTGREDFAGKCLSCILVPASEPQQCPSGWKLNRDQSWHLAPLSGCTWASGCLGLPCPANTVEGQTASCGGTGIARSCCPLEPHLMCCQALQCSRSSDPSGACIVDDKSLLPGQTATTQVYAFQRTGGSCSTYSYYTQRTCQANWTLTSGPFYDTCTPVTPTPDPRGCPVIAGYTLMLGLTYQNASEAALQDQTPWDQLPAASRSTAALDPILMASRCDVLPDCGAFDSDTGVPTLRAYAPVEPRWRTTNGLPAAAYRCAGTYVKQLSLSSCPRVFGYLFTPGVTWVAPSGQLSDSVCDSCGVATDMATLCNTTATCAAFSNMHGLLNSPSAAAASATLSHLQPFTTTSCKGLFTRVGSVVPAEVESLDMLLCGMGRYCQPSLHYSWSTEGSWVDVTVTLTADLEVPSWLLYPNDVTLQVLPRVETVRSLQVVCPEGRVVRGGVPRQLLYLLPALQRLSMPGCGISGTLGADLPSLAGPYFHVLNLASNSLTGPLPASWGGGAWTMSMLNLSSNQLVGTIPSSWVSVPATASSLDWGSASPASDSTASLNVLDLSHNQLSGPVPRSIITDTCLYGSLRLEFDTAASASEGATAGRGPQQEPLLALYGNPQLQQWAGGYLVASAQRLYSRSESRINLCGSYGYIIAICIMWGAFLVATLGILGYGWWRRRQGCVGDRALLTKSSSKTLPDDDPAATTITTVNPLASVLTASAARTVGSWWEQQWAQLWVRQLVFIARLGVLVADMALDIAVVMWLWHDGETTEAIVCIAFIGLAQAVVGLGVFWQVFLPAFPSVCALLLGGPPLLALTPLLGACMAAWNIKNPSVPLVSWRYLELQEFAVVLFQAPSQAVTKTIIYARHSKLGGGMYIPHALFIAAIVLSLTDMAISLYKLVRYKLGPWARIRNAFCHLDQSRDAALYQALDNAWYATDRPGSRYTGYSIEDANERYRLSLLSSKLQQSDGSMRNPLLMVSESQSGAVQDGSSSPVDGARSHLHTGAGESQSGTSPREHTHQSADVQGQSGLLHRISQGSNTSMLSAHSGWSLTLPPPPTHTSLLQQSSLRLAVHTAMDALSSSMPVAHPVGQPGPPSSITRRYSASNQQPATTTLDIHRTASVGLKPKPPLQRPLSATSSTSGVRVSQSGPSIGRSPLGKRHSNASMTSNDDSPPDAAHGSSQGYIPAHLPASRCSTSDWVQGYGTGVQGCPGSPAAASPRVSNGHIGSHSSEVVLGLLRRVNSQESSYHSAASHQTGFSTPTQHTTPQYSPQISRRSSHAGPAGQLQVNVGDPAGVPEPSPPRSSTSEVAAWQPAVHRINTGRPSASGRAPSPSSYSIRPGSPSKPPGSPVHRTPRSPSPVPGSPHTVAVSLDGLFSSTTPLSPAASMRPPLPPSSRPPGTPRSRPSSAIPATQVASPRAGIATLSPARASSPTGSFTTTTQPSSPSHDTRASPFSHHQLSSATRFHPMPTPPPHKQDTHQQ